MTPAILPAAVSRGWRALRGCGRAALLAALLLPGADFPQQRAGADTVEAARELYGSAAYQEALDLLDRLKGARPAPQVAAEIDAQRALCLLALGRMGEARQVFAQILIANPEFRLSEDEVSRRVLDIFREVRRESLPATLTRAFQLARHAYEYQLWDDAGRAFERVIALSQDPDMPAGAPHAAEMAELSRGYLDVMAARRPPIKSRPWSGAAVLPSAQEVFGESDLEVTPPEPIDQRVPPWPSVLRSVQASGVIEIVVDEEGRVVSAAMRPAAHPAYDSMLLEAARQWRYRPALRGDVPVKYVRRIRIVNDPRLPDAPARRP